MQEAVHHDRRRSLRVSLRVHARGQMAIEGKFIDFQADVVNLSDEGVGMILYPDSYDRFKALLPAAEGGNFAEMRHVAEKVGEIHFVIISYVTDNIRLTGNLKYIGHENNSLFLGIETTGTEEFERKLIAGLVESRPELNLKNSASFEVGEHHFADFSDFTARLTEYLLLYGKGDAVVIGGNSYRFAGPHKVDYSDVYHFDCIEDVDDSSKIFCPDCQSFIDLGTTII